MGKIKVPCTSCGGTGQISFFQGVSRFLLTMDECPECNGLGYLQEKKDGSCPSGKKKRNKRKKE